MANVQVEHTLCWDCANACGGCSWSFVDHKPVPGWVAEKTELKTRRKIAGLNCSFIVRQCPQFIRDAYDGGLKWSDKDNTIIRRGRKRKTE